MKFSQAVLFAATPFVSGALAFFVVPLMTWSFGPDDVARFGMFQYLTSGGVLVATLGMDQAFIREIVESKRKDALLRACLLPCLLAIIFILGILVIKGPRLGQNLFGFENSVVIWILIANISLQVILRFAGQYVRITKNGFSYFVAELGLRLPLILTLLIWFFKGTDLNIVNLMIIQVLGSAAAASILVAKSGNMWKLALLNREKENIYSSVDLLKFGLPLAVAGVFYWCIVNFGVFFARYFFGLEATAQLIVATSLANVAVLGQGVFSLIWLPIAYSWIPNSICPTDVERIGNRVVVGGCLLTILIFPILHAITPFLGIKFQNVAPIASGLCVLPILYTVSEVTFIGLMINKRGHLALAAVGSALLVCIVFNLALLQLIGIAGAVISVNLAALTFLIARTELSCRAWKPIKRITIYTGGTLICSAGCLSSLLDGYWSLLSILILIPYIFLQRNMLTQIYFGFIKTIKIKKIFGV